MPQDLLPRLFQRKVIPFLGAGCSVAPPSQIPPADRLAQQLIDCGAGSEGQALEDIAEDAWARGGWQEFAQLLPVDEWRVRPPNVAARVLAELSKETLISQIVTTNWDVLIEAALLEIGQPYSKVVDAHSLAIEPAGRVTLIKLNGCIEHPEFIKATRTHIEDPDWLDAWIQGLFDVLVRSNSILFAGYSGASRAATTTIGRLVGAGERHAADFLVDRAQPEQITASSESGSRFIAAINLVAPFTGEATDFFAALRDDLHPLLISAPAACAKSMAKALLDPTTVPHDDLAPALTEIVAVFKAAGAAACQHWARSSFGSFPDLEHSDPYVPILPNETDFAKCLLLLTAIRWASCLGRSDGLDFMVAATHCDISTQLPLRLVVGHGHSRRDVAARAAVAELAREDRQTPTLPAVGVAFGGIGSVDGPMTGFSATRGPQVPNAARGSGAAVAWIDGDLILSDFREGLGDADIQGRIRKHIDEAAASVLAVSMG